MLLEIFFDGFFGFADVDSEEDEALVGELVADFVDESGFVGTETAPSGPEFQQSDFAFYGVVGEFFAGGGDGVKAGGGLFVLGASKRAKRRENHYRRNCYPEKDGSRRHGGNIRKSRLAVNYFVDAFKRF